MTHQPTKLQFRDGVHALILLVLLTGCNRDYLIESQMPIVKAEQNIANFWRNNPLTTGYWYNKDKTLEEASITCQNCLFEAKKATINVYPLDIQASNEVSLFLDCMKIYNYEYFLPDKLPNELKTIRIDYVGIAGK